MGLKKRLLSFVVAVVLESLIRSSYFFNYRKYLDFQHEAYMSCA